MSWSADDIAARFNFMRAAHTGLPPITSISTFELAGALIYLEFFVILAIFASILDYFSYARFKDALDDAPIIRALSRMSELQGTAFVVDRVLDGEHPCVATSAALSRPADASAHALFPLLAVARGAASPVEMLLESHVLPDDSNALVLAAARANGVAFPPDAFLTKRTGSVADRVNAAVGSEASCGARCCALHRVLARYTLLKLYFSHSLLSPLTRFNPRVTRVSQVGMFFKHLLAVIFSGVALYSFYSKGVGKIDDTSYLTVYLGAFHVLGIVFTIAICEFTRLIIGSLLEAGSELTFAHRYPLVNAERIRRHAADLRAAVMTPDELAAAISTARLAQSAHRAGGGLSSPTDAEGGGGGEEENEGARPRVIVDNSAAEVAASPTGAAAAASLLLQNPSDEYLLAIAAAPFLAEVAKARGVGNGPLSSSITSVDDGSGRSKITAAALGANKAGGGNAGDAVIDVNAGGSKGAPPKVPVASCCLNRSKNRAPKDEAAVLAENEAVRTAAAREESRAQLLWETAQKSLSAARSAHAAYAALSLRDAVLAVCSNNAYIFKLATLICFFAICWYVLVGLALQTDAVTENFFQSFLIYQAGLFAVVEPLTIAVTVLGQLVIWPGLRALIFRTPFGVGRAIRRFVARAKARSKNVTRNTDPAAVRAAAIAVHFPAALAVFAYGGALAFSSVTSGAVDSRVAKVTATTDQQIVAAAIAQRAEDNAVEEADADADHAEAEDAARAAGMEPPPPPPPRLERNASHHHVVISAEERIALANFEIMKIVATLEVSEAERIASRRGVNDDAPTSPTVQTPRSSSAGRLSYYAELRSGVASLANRLVRRPSMRDLFALSSRAATVAPAPPQPPTQQQSAEAPGEPTALAASAATVGAVPATSSFRSIVTSISQTLSIAASASVRMLARLSPTSPSELGGDSAFVPFATAADDSPEEALLNELTFDFGPHIEGPLAAWRAANPDAQAARLNGRRDLTDDDCAFLRGVRVLNIAGCSQLTDAAFAHFGSLEVLVMNGCANVTEVGFAHMPRLRKLLMKNCLSATDGAFKNLVHLRQLDVDGCRKLTAAALDGLPELRIVSAHLCDPKLKVRAEELMKKNARRPAVGAVRPHTEPQRAPGAPRAPHAPHAPHAKTVTAAKKH